MKIDKRSIGRLRNTVQTLNPWLFNKGINQPNKKGKTRLTNNPNSLNFFFEIFII